MRTARFLLPVVAIFLAGAALADPPAPSICLSLTCEYDIPDESAPHKGVVEVAGTCQGVTWFGTLEISRTCNPNDPCVDETTTDTGWSIGPGIGAQTTVLDCRDEECCSRRRSAPNGPWIMPMNFSATLTVDAFTIGTVHGQAITPFVFSCSQSGDVCDTNKCPRDE